MPPGMDRWTARSRISGSITWTGPIADDYITIGAAPGATSHDDTLPYADIADGNPAKLKAPATAGDVTTSCASRATRSATTMGRRPLTVT